MDALSILAQLHDDMNNTQIAITTLQRLIQLVPTHTSALYKLANLLYRSDKYSEALKVARTLVAVEPGSREGISLVAAIQNKVGSAPAKLTVKEQCPRNSL